MNTTLEKAKVNFNASLEFDTREDLEYMVMFNVDEDNEIMVVVDSEEDDVRLADFENETIEVLAGELAKDWRELAEQEFQERYEQDMRDYRKEMRDNEIYERADRLHDLAKA